MKSRCFWAAAFVPVALLAVSCSGPGESASGDQPLAVEGSKMTDGVLTSGPAGSPPRPMLVPALFPLEAQGSSGTVTVRIKVREGRVLAASVLDKTKGVHPALVREALKAAREAQFPADFTGQHTVPYTFKSF